MKIETLQVLRCPACHGGLDAAGGHPGGTLEDAELSCTSCRRVWPVRSGVPQLVFPEELAGEDLRARRLWDRISPIWGLLLAATNVIRGIHGLEEPRQLAEKLELQPGHAVLETAAGAGRNLGSIAQAVGEQGLVFGLDLSAQQLRRAPRALRHLANPPELILGNSSHLPFDDGAFDAVLDGFGMKYYPDKRRAMEEMLRVVKPGGKVVIAELGLPEGKRRTLRQRILLLWLPHFRDPPPIDQVPDSVQDLTFEWDAPGTVYTIAFRKPETADGTDGTANEGAVAPR